MTEFKRGEIVEVCNNPDLSPFFEDWKEKIFLAKIEGADTPYICVVGAYEDEFREGKPFQILSWKHCRKGRPDLKMDDPLIVWNEQEGRSNAHLRHFMEWSEDGRPLCWDDGCTSWTVCYPTHYSKWDHYEIPDKEG